MRAASGADRIALAAVAAAFVAMAMLRPVDHDESQYVAAAVLTAAGRLPYADFAYLQTPLQPFAFAPLAAAAGRLAWPALRIANALLGAIAVAGVHRGARAVGADPRQALAAALLFAGCDALLFSVGVARNDALPVACFAWAAALIADGRPGARGAVAIGALLALAAAAKISYAVPAATFGVHALVVRDRRLLPIALGAIPVVAFVAWTAWLSPAGFLFGTLDFPANAPAQYYAGHPWKLSPAAKVVDAAKFLALGAGLPALAIVARDVLRRRPGALEALLAGSTVAALLPAPTWRQYLLPVLPPLFVLLASCWRERPAGRTQRRVLGTFAAAGLLAAAAAILAPSELRLPSALRQARAASRLMDALGIAGPVATLSPELLPATGRLPDARFATGPFYFRSDGLLGTSEEERLGLVSVRTASDALAGSTVALVGGETGATSGDPRLDAALARAFGGRRVPVPGSGLTLLVRAPGSLPTRTIQSPNVDAREVARAHAGSRGLRNEKDSQ